MNKTLLIVLLAVCLVSTHAFVKRDAPDTNQVAADFQAQIQALINKITEEANKISAEANKNLNPEKIKEKVNEFIDAASKAVNNFKPTEATPSA